jgi:hypothetical protein
MAIVKTSFEPGVDDFAFANSWSFEPLERQQLRDTVTSYLTLGAILGGVAFGFAGAVLVPVGIVVLRKKLEDEFGQGYGLCGGMSFASLDAYLASIPLPRGEDRHDRPAAGTALRRYIWRRQIESLVSDLPRFLAWLILLNFVPSSRPFNGGSGRLAAMTMREWDLIRSRLDSGRPVPLGLVRDTKNVFENHQVLAIGYEQESERQGTVFAYDPNCPGVESTIQFTFDGERSVFQESCRAATALRGFFGETYSPADPREAVDQ